MRVVLIARATLYTAKGGDTLQVDQIARHLGSYGITADIKLTSERIDYEQYDLLHFFNVGRPADILYHIGKTSRPFVVSPVLIDYSGYDKYHRSGISGSLFKFLKSDNIEYLKTLARWILGKDKLMSTSYLWKGQRKSIQMILERAAMVLPSSDLEYERLVQSYNISCDYIKVPNGVDHGLFEYNNRIQKDPRLVLCVARIEGIKNQINLVKALNNTDYRLVIIGTSAPNQFSYYDTCRKIAADNVLFMGQLTQHELVQYYQKAKVHILPSWFETCGLSTLEAGAMGCNVVITDKGYTREYYEDDALYCDPASPSSILTAVKKASANGSNEKFRNRILSDYTWEKAAEQTAIAYKKVIDSV